MGLGELAGKLRDAVDVLRHARDLKELARAVVPLESRRVLNRGPAEPVDPTKLAQSLRALGGLLRAEAVDEQGRVRYSRLAGSEGYRALERESRALAHVKPELLASDAERLAFWINLYNVLAIHGVVALGIERSVMEVPSFFSLVAYDVGGHELTPDDIENGVLRRNAPHPATRARPFSPEDPRMAFCPSRVDPRIHAALVCASRSCPPVRFYTPEDLEAELDRATASYVAAEVEVKGDALELPITFRYYAEDFGSWPAFFSRHAEGAHRAAILAALARGAPLEYRRYDWSLNGV